MYELLSIVFGVLIAYLILSYSKSNYQTTSLGCQGWPVANADNSNLAMSGVGLEARAAAPTPKQVVIMEQPAPQPIMASQNLALLSPMISPPSPQTMMISPPSPQTMMISSASPAPIVRTPVVPWNPALTQMASSPSPSV